MAKALRHHCDALLFNYPNTKPEFGGTVIMRSREQRAPVNVYYHPQWAICSCFDGVFIFILV